MTAAFNSMRRPAHEMLTKDKKNLEVAWYVDWKVADVERFLRSVRPRYPRRLRAARRHGFERPRGGIGRTRSPDLVKVGGDSAIDAMMREVTERVNDQAGKEFGLIVVDVQLRRLNYPEEVREAVFEQIRSERKRVAAATRAEGESQARTIRSTADLERSKIVAEADAEAAPHHRGWRGQAARIANEAHSADPGFYHFLKTLDTYRAGSIKKRRSSYPPIALLESADARSSRGDARTREQPLGCRAVRTGAASTSRREPPKETRP